MKISLVQHSIVWLDRVANRAAAQRWLDECRGSRMVLFSEMFTTGYCLTPHLCAEADGHTLSWMQQQASLRDMVIGGGVAVAEGDTYYNRFFLVYPNGDYRYYDKRHLFSYAGEQKCYAAGDERVVVEVDGVRILLLVCYDLRFPVWARNRGDYDMILCVANWPASRRKAWDILFILLRSRAIENLSYVGGVNIVGSDDSCSYSGGTAVVDFRGESIAAVDDNTEGVASVELDMAALERFRAKFPALDDGDEFGISFNCI